MYLTAYLLWRNREGLLKSEGDRWSVYPIFLIAAKFFSLWLRSAEVINYFGRQRLALTVMERVGPVGCGLRNAQNLSLTGRWAIYAGALLVVGISKRLRPMRLVAQP